MKMAFVMSAALMSLSTLASWAPAQPRQAPDREAGQDRPPMIRRDRADGPPGRLEGERGGGELLGPRRGAPLPSISFDQVERMRNWLDVIDRYARMAHNPVDAGIAAVVSANDLLRPRGAEATIDYFNKMLPEVKNEAVRRVVRLQLVDLYRANGQADKALEQLQVLMTSAPAEPVEPAGPPPGRAQ